MDERPELSPELAEAELTRWYWTMAELQLAARELGLSAAGPKADLIERLRAHLRGETQDHSTRVVTPGPKPIAEPLTLSSVIPTGQRSTQALRAFFVSHLGPSFTFDGHMRSFLRESEGSTLADAIEHWSRTRGIELPPQSQSLEFNRFTKEWHRAHPDCSPVESRQAWQRYRALPVDQRPPVAEA